MIDSHRKQQGLTMTSILMLIIVICGVVLLLLKVVPIYMNHGKVKSAIESVVNLKDAEQKSKAQINKLLRKRFSVNSIYDLPKDAIKVIKRGNYVKIIAKYEVKEKLFANLNVLVEFDEFVEAGRK
jgi:uncharacterized membrane protein